MEETITAIQDTPVPTILIVAGLFFLLLAFVNKLGGIIQVSPEQRKWTIPVGLLVLGIGLVLYLVPSPDSVHDTVRETDIDHDAKRVTDIDHDAERETMVAPIIDACKINPIFCGQEGRSKVPGFSSGAARLDAGRDTSTTLTLSIAGSVPNVEHSVFLCPGAISHTGGFIDCRRVGSFMTNRKGNGGYMKVLKRIPTENVVSINVPKLKTVLANCPNETNAMCSPSPPLGALVK